MISPSPYPTLEDTRPPADVKHCQDLERSVQGHCSRDTRGGGVFNCPAFFDAPGSSYCVDSLRARFNDFEGVQFGLGVGFGTGSDWSSPQINPRGWTGGLLFHPTELGLGCKKNQPPRRLFFISDESELEACLLAPRLAHVHPAMPPHWSPAFSSWGICSFSVN